MVSDIFKSSKPLNATISPQKPHLLLFDVSPEKSLF